MSVVNKVKAEVKYVLALAYQLVVVGKEKAVVAFLVTAVVPFVAQHGLTLNVSGVALLEALLFGVLAHLAVYFAPNSKV